MNKINLICFQDDEVIKQEGSGWRLAWDPSRQNFPILLGGQGWACELSEFEWQCFVQLVLDLVDEHKKMKQQLMSEESVSLEIERESCWGCLEGNKDKWSLHVLFQSEGDKVRSFEASRPSPIAKDFVHGMRNMWDSYQ